LLFASLFLLVFLERLVIFIEVVVYAGQFQRLDADNLIFGSTLITGNDVAFFDFIQFDV